tara:strand:- start:735 stop:1151 length:417 start_codon:yes stop_codon:yes gene_type:complete
MKWFDILKNRSWGSLKPLTEDIKHEREEEPLEVPEADTPIDAPKLTDYRGKSKSKISAKARSKRDKPDGPVGEETKDLNIRELRSQLMRESRGHHSKLADNVTRLAAKAREDSRKQVYYLGRIRRLIRMAQIPEVKRK